MDLFRLVGSIFINNSDANSQIDNTTKKAEGMSKKLSSAFKTAGDKITGVGKTLAPISAGVGAILGASVKGASDFNDGMAKMSTLFDTTQTSVTDLSKEFLDLSNKTGLSATELAEAGYQALSAGQNVETVGKFVETAGNLAKAGFTSTTTAVDVLTTAMNAYGEGAGTAEEISNKLVRTQNLGKTTVDELASSMGKIIPTASSMGVNIDNLTSGYVSLTKQGIATAEATTYMNSMLNELGDSGTDLGGILKDQTGKSFQELMNEGYSLADVLQITKNYADENGIAYNELWGSAEAGKAGLAILNGGVEEFNSTVSTMADKTDDVGQALDKLNTPSAKARKALTQVKNSGIELGTSLLSAMLPTIEKCVGAVERFSTWFSSLDDKTKVVIGGVMAFVAGLAPFLLILGKVISVVGTVVGWFSTLSAAVISAGGVIALLTNPITLVVGAILGLIAVFTTLYTTNEDFRNLVQEAWTTIQSTIGTVISSVQGLISEFVNIAKAMWSAWGDDLIALATNAFTFISSFIDNTLKIIQAIIKTVTSVIKGDWTAAWNNIKTLLTTVWNAIKSLITTALNVIKSLITTALNVIKTTFSTVWNAVKSLVSTVWNAMKSTISTVLNAIKSTISNVLNSIKSTISTVWNAIKSTVTNVLNAIKTTVTNVWNNIKSKISNSINGIKSSISSGMNSAKSTVTGVLNAIKSKFTSIWNTCKSTVQTAISTIKSAMNFSWSLPHLKLPHISISGSFSLNPPSAPHFSIDWYKKAMDNPLMFTRPTLFDVNPLTGTAKGAGEAGDEVMIGKNTMLGMIQEAVRNEVGNTFEALNRILERIFQLLSDYIPDLTNKKVVLDTGAVVGELAPKMDTEFGKIIKHKGRGN